MSAIARALCYPVLAIQARATHNKYGVSAEYLEKYLRIQWHNKVDDWDDWRRTHELRALVRLYPEDTRQHQEYLESHDAT